MLDKVMAALSEDERQEVYDAQDNQECLELAEAELDAQLARIHEAAAAFDDGYSEGC